MVQPAKLVVNITWYKADQTGAYWPLKLAHSPFLRFKAKNHLKWRLIRRNCQNLGILPWKVVSKRIRTPPPFPPCILDENCRLPHTHHCQHTHSSMGPMNIDLNKYLQDNCLIQRFFLRTVARQGYMIFTYSHIFKEEAPSCRSTHLTKSSPDAIRRPTHCCWS